MAEYYLSEQTWIEKRKWEYYTIQIDSLLSSKISDSESQELINIYDEYRTSNKDVPIQLQEYINLMMSEKNLKKIIGQPNESLKDYKKVLLVASVIRRQASGFNKINAINQASKFFGIPPKIFFDIYTHYQKKAENFIQVEPDIKELDKLLGL
tara:strand:- start:710 stop:1168 length:459 start_codon:yes stop_codon:yes gene_type:complete